MRGPGQETANTRSACHHASFLVHAATIAGAILLTFATPVAAVVGPAVVAAAVAEPAVVAAFAAPIMGAQVRANAAIYMYGFFDFCTHGVQIGAVAGAVAGFSESRSTNAQAHRVSGALRDAERARGIALVDADHAAARRNTRSACLGIAAGIQRHGWEADMLEPASRLISLIFNAAAVRLGRSATGGAPDARVIIIRAHVLQTALSTGLLQTMAGLARLHYRRVTATTDVILAISDALRSAVSVATTHIDMPTPDVASQGHRNGRTYVSLTASPVPLDSISCDESSRNVEAGGSVIASTTVAFAGAADVPATAALPAVDDVAQAAVLAAAAATAAAFLLGEAVTEAAVYIDQAVHSMQHFASKAASVTSRGQPLLLRSIIELSEVMQVWPRSRDGRAAQFRAALRILRTASPTDSRIADAFEGEAARLAQFKAPPRVTTPVTLSSLPNQGFFGTALQESSSSGAPGGAAADPSPTPVSVTELQPITDRQFEDSRLAPSAQPLETTTDLDVTVSRAAPSA